VKTLLQLYSRFREGEWLAAGCPLSENRLNMALRTLGFDGNSHVAHGLRSTASSLLHERGYLSEVIEAQLAARTSWRRRRLHQISLAQAAPQAHERMGRLPRRAQGGYAGEGYGDPGRHKVKGSLLDIE